MPSFIQAPPSHLPQVLVDELDHHRALAHCGGDALDRARSYVARREDARPARLEQERMAAHVPVRRVEEPGTGANEVLGVLLDLRGQPLRARDGADEAEEGRALEGTPLTRFLALELHPPEGAVAGEAFHLRLEQDLDGGGLLDPRYEIRGHVLVQAVPTDHQVHLARVPGEIHGGLARGVATTHYQHVRALAGPGLVRGCRIVHAASLELATPLHAEEAVVGPRGDEEALRGHRFAALELEDLVGVVEAEAERGGGEGELSPELVRLEQGALGEIRARDPRGKAEVVLDAHAPTRRAARRSRATVWRPSEAPYTAAA